MTEENKRERPPHWVENDAGELVEVAHREGAPPSEPKPTAQAPAPEPDEIPIEAPIKE